MSNYTFKARNKKTGEVVRVTVLFNHYGRRNHGFMIGDEPPYQYDDFIDIYDRIETIGDTSKNTLEAERRGAQQERIFIENILTGIEAANRDMGLGESKDCAAIRFALKNRIIN